MGVAGIFKKLRSLIPPSSRSFHQMYGDINAYQRATEVAIQDLHANQKRIEAMLEAQNGEIAKTQEELHALDLHMSICTWQLYREEEESYEDARKRFFRTLPKATDELRLYQLACTRLMQDFHSVCEKLEIPYWAISGTLLGAIRHGGFIPWDDDLDVGMLRDNLTTLMQAMEHDKRYQITEVYDWFVHCRQIRFCYRDESIPCFVDIFIYDLSTLPGDEACEPIRKDRESMIQNMKADDRLAAWNYDNPLVAAGDDLSAAIAESFDAVIAREFAPGGHLTHDLQEARSVVYSADNMDWLPGFPTSYDYDDVFPTQLIDFEGIKIAGPSEVLDMLKKSFGDYYQLPDDIDSVSYHITDEALRSKRTQAALERLLQQGDAIDDRDASV